MVAVARPPRSELPEFRRPWGILHDPALDRAVAALDARRDCQAIARALSGDLFPFDITRSLEVALLHTYGARRVAKLLAATGEFERRGQRRYDDTGILIGRFVDMGWDHPEGAAALEQMNAIHGRFSIPNDDFLFVLWTFIEFPIAWMKVYGWRAFSEHEAQAWFYFWSGVGERMGIREIPKDKAAFDAWVEAYEEREMIPTEAAAKVTEATLEVSRGWLPSPFRFLVEPVARCLCRPRFLHAAGLRPPHPWLRAIVHATLRVRSYIKRVLPLEPYGRTMAGQNWRSYPGGAPSTSEVGPS